MFTEKAIKCVNDAIRSELDEATGKYGEKYRSQHEAYAVLKEEYEEARDEYLAINSAMYDAWNCVKVNNEKGFRSSVEHIRHDAEKLALEAVQVCAVCEKILRGCK